MKGIKITVIMLLISQAIVAQTKTAKEIATKKVEKIESSIELSVDQKVAISEIALASATQMLEHKTAGTLDKEVRHKLRVNEHKQINALLTADQRTALKEARKHNKAEKVEYKEQKLTRKNAKVERNNLLQEKRTAFENSLSNTEKAAIEKARNLMPAKVKGKEALSEEHKADAKAKRKEANKILKPIAENHKTEIEAIQAQLPAKPAKKEVKKGKKKGDHFAYKFLLMK